MQRPLAPEPTKQQTILQPFATDKNVAHTHKLIFPDAYATLCITGKLRLADSEMQELFTHLQAHTQDQEFHDTLAAALAPIVRL